MKIRRSSLPLFIILIAISLLYFYYKDQEDILFNDTVASSQNTPSAYIQNGHFVIYNTDGFATELNSKEAVFYENSDLVKIKRPIIHLALPSKQKVIITSDSGLLYPQVENIVLEGNVEVVQDKPSNSDWSLKGKDFNFDNNRHFISTEQAVTITSSNASMTSIGLRAWLDNKKIELLSKVRGEYVFSEN